MKSIIFLFSLFIGNTLFAQNPFESAEAKSKMLTYSNGRFNESFDDDTLVQIGTVMFNTLTKRIVSFVEEDTNQTALKPEVTSRWLSPDPLAYKYASISPYVYCENNPIIYIDPDGRENKYALAWAKQNMANKGVKSDYSNPWYGGSDNRWTFTNDEKPTRSVCYESCWTAYMNSGGNITPLLKETGFSTPSGGFKGRSTETGGMNWFKAGDGSDRSFVTDIAKGELGDIAFMGESGNMQGHAVLLSGLPASSSYEDEDGNTIETMTFEALSTSSTSDPGNYGTKNFTFEKQKDGSWQQKGGGYTFRGYGQLNEQNMKGDESLLPQDNSTDKK